MRILVTIAHYFSAEANSRHGSTSERKRDDRQRAIEEVICAYRGQFGVSTTLHVGTKSFQPGVGSDDEIDIVAVTTGEKHLLTPDFCRRYGVKVAKLDLENPRMLGFSAQQIMAQQASKYDMFVFTEDDLRINDPTFFSKIIWFNQTYGPQRVLFPNRIEWNRDAPTLKTYIDGDLGVPAADRMNGYVPDESTLYAAPLGRQTVFRRARNPHAGYFAVTRDQLDHWMRQPHWLDRDVSFVSPLESAATLGMAKTFSIYKAFGRSAGFLEIEHLDNGFSNLKMPVIPPL
ncbi:MAG: calcium-binding protein [Pseudomonadota bacterium]